ncbi:Rmf/CrpP family protein [Rhizobium wenxiniae]|uniref:Rmf/CrpP family protein n=1 Tax=Rhizobium wenxiniae TaxID=1737357 RepID=UPI003C1E07B9
MIEKSNHLLDISLEDGAAHFQDAELGRTRHSFAVSTSHDLQKLGAGSISVTLLHLNRGHACAFSIVDVRAVGDNWIPLPLRDQVTIARVSVLLNEPLGNGMNVTDEERKAVRDEGIIAALRDKSSTECPYPDEYERHAIWIGGYNAANPELDK